MKLLLLVPFFLVSCGYSLKRQQKAWADGLEPLLPIEATSPEQQAKDLQTMRNNPIFGILYQ